jgi:hypothetical protein
METEILPGIPVQEGTTKRLDSLKAKFTLKGRGEVISMLLDYFENKEDLRAELKVLEASRKDIDGKIDKLKNKIEIRKRIQSVEKAALMKSIKELMKRYSGDELLELIKNSCKIKGFDAELILDEIDFSQHL